jgi:hypothetical protein
MLPASWLRRASQSEWEQAEHSFGGANCLSTQRIQVEGFNQSPADGCPSNDSIADPLEVMVPEVTARMVQRHRFGGFGINPGG